MKGFIRVLLHAAACGCLALLGWNAFQPPSATAPPVTEVTLWTPGPAASLPSRGLHLALPGTTHAPDDTPRIPDLGSLRRRFPALRRLHLEGDGLDAASAGQAAGLEITWRRPAEPRFTAPEVVALCAPRTLTTGERMSIQGQVRGLRPGGALTIALEGPSGSTVSAELQAAEEGQAVFTLTDPEAAAAPGAFAWRMRLGTTAEPLVLGAAVVEPELPRVLILQAAPSVEGARLHRWLAAAGARVTSRTRVSADHVRFASANGSPEGFSALDSATLAGFDVIVATEPVLRELPADSVSTLDDAIREQGLGLLVIGDPSDAGSANDLLPWSVRQAADTGTAEESRMTRLRSHTGAELNEPIGVLPLDLLGPPDARSLVRDTQGRPVVSTVRHARGWLARSLVIDSWRWSQRGFPGTYAALWSTLLSAIAAPASPAKGRWIIESPSEPLQVDHPVRLAWLGPDDGRPPDAAVRQASLPEIPPVPLRLSRDPTEPSVSRTLFWPTLPGWHEVRAPSNGPTLAFLVHPADAWSALRAQHRQDTTARLADGSGHASASATTHPATQPPPVRQAVAFALFLAVAVVLWISERRYS